MKTYSRNKFMYVYKCIFIMELRKFIMIYSIRKVDVTS